MLKNAKFMSIYAEHFMKGGGGGGRVIVGPLHNFLGGHLSCVTKRYRGVGGS